mgnify:CR=1 FL=1
MGAQILGQLVGDANSSFWSYWRSRPGVFAVGGMHSPFALADVDAALASGLFREPYVEMWRDGRRLPVTDFTSTRTVARENPGGFADEVKIRALLDGGATMLLHASTVFLSAFLLFLVQPILAKQILPWFGGAAIVWTMCMVFFQLVLLLGYAYAHWLSGRVRGEKQVYVHIALLAASLVGEEAREAPGTLVMRWAIAPPVQLSASASVRPRAASASSAVAAATAVKRILRCTNTAGSSVMTASAM